MLKNEKNHFIEYRSVEMFAFVSYISIIIRVKVLLKKYAV